MTDDKPATQLHTARDGGRAHDQGPATSVVRTFVQILLLEAVILVGLWWFGRAYS